MVDLIKIGQTIESLRKSKNMTQDDLASSLYVSRQAISKWECGKGMPSIEILIELTRLFDVSIDALIDGAELSKQDYNAQFNQLPRTAVFSNFIQSKTLSDDVKHYFYLFTKDERAQFIDLIINKKLHLPYVDLWPYLSEDERIYLLGFLLTKNLGDVEPIIPYLNIIEQQILRKKHPYHKTTYYFKRKE